MKTILLISFFTIILLSGCRQNYKASIPAVSLHGKKNIRTIQYVNKDAGKGNITLNLHSDLSFNMIIQYRNKYTDKLSGTSDSISGEWSKKDTMCLVLK